MWFCVTCTICMIYFRIIKEDITNENIKKSKILTLAESLTQATVTERIVDFSPLNSVR